MVHIGAIPTILTFPQVCLFQTLFRVTVLVILCHFGDGSLLVQGKVSKVDPPHLVMPITVEPGMPRMCYDERFF